MITDTEKGHKKAQQGKPCRALRLAQRLAHVGQIINTVHKVNEIENINFQLLHAVDVGCEIGCRVFAGSFRGSGGGQLAGGKLRRRNHENVLYGLLNEFARGIVPILLGGAEITETVRQNAEEMKKLAKERKLEM